LSIFNTLGCGESLCSGGSGKLEADADPLSAAGPVVAEARLAVRVLVEKLKNFELDLRVVAVEAVRDDLVEVFVDEQAGEFFPSLLSCVFDAGGSTGAAPPAFLEESCTILHLWCQDERGGAGPLFSFHYKWSAMAKSSLASR